jgi:hypothetical protein
MDIFKLYFTPDVIQNVIAKWINAFALHSIAEYNASHPNHPARDWKPADEIELYAFFGILIRAGLDRGLDQPVNEFWSKNPE